ncbi:MAG: outer membrane beta-barrel protein [Deltaproteobacteria bacterium]|nr:outer membrane beta-barrel protein [Deltaproteobacteria bacterium]
MLSTLIPISPIVKSIESAGQDPANLGYSTFFNFELGASISLLYHWQIYSLVGYYTYDTRKENSNKGTDPASGQSWPLFHQFEMSCIPIIVGAKYRFSTEDVVPYVGAGAGFSFVKRKSFYDYAPMADEENLNVVTVQLLAGVEFYFAPRMGLRIEAAGYYMRLPERVYNPAGTGTNPGQNPVIISQANPLSIRYASGVFFQF